MSQLSPKLSLPYIQPAQAQKHVTHNEALRILDAVAHLYVAGFDAVTPPAEPSNGDIYALGANPTGVWANFGGQLVTFENGIWSPITPNDGWLATSPDATLRMYLHGAWVFVDVDMQNLPGVGINTSYDSTNALAVASEASLFNHGGEGHQIKVNKATQSDTASLLFQSGYAGHAEIGLVGNNDLAIKISPDGTTFTTALSFDSATGVASGTAVQQSADDATPGRLMRADYGYGPGNIIGPVSHNAGSPTGAIIERGENANGEFVRFADGTQICTNFATSSMATDQAIGAMYKSADALWLFPAVFSSVNAVSIFASSDNVGNWAVARPLGASSARYRQYSATHSATPFNTRLFAIGTWY